MKCLFAKFQAFMEIISLFPAVLNTYIEINQDGLFNALFELILTGVLSTEKLLN